MMTAKGLVILLAACAASAVAEQGAAKQQSLEKAWGREMANAKVSPIKRVVSLLQKMKSELDAEAANEAEMYDKMVCWCETNEKEKTKAIADAETKIEDLEAEIESRAAAFGGAEAEIANLKEQIADDTAALKEATAIREKEAAAFRKSEKESVQAITNLKNAVQVLEKHQFLQTGSGQKIEGTLLESMKVVLRDLSLKYELIMAGKKEASQKHAKIALVELAAHTQAATGDMKELLNALDAEGTDLSRDLPVKYAATMLARAVAKSRKASGSSAFLQAGQPAGAGESYSSQSGGIFGIMTQMLDEFQATLKTEQADEKKAAADYEAMAAAKEEQLTVAKEKLDEMEAQHAGNIKALSDAKEDLTSTREQRRKDVDFLQNLKITCGDLDSQWEKRSKTRTAEIQAVSEALAIITEDDAREMLAKSVSLLQTSAAMQQRRSAAAAALRAAAAAPTFEADDLLDAWAGRRGGKVSLLGAAAGPRTQLSTLALAVSLDSFTKVKAMMDKMVADLKSEQEEEVKFKAYCTKELNANEKATYEKTELKKDLEAKIEELATLMKKIAEEIAAAQAEIAETQVSIKKASQQREGENAEFQSVVADQRATQTILKKALQKLKDFYEKGIGKAALVQEQQTPPVQFNKQKDNAGASPVMGLIEQIIEDSVKLESEATEGEYAAQADYEKFVKESNALIKSLTEAVVEKTKASSAAKEDSAEAKGDLESTIGELEGLTQVNADLHGECDFVLKNFDIRQKARLQEIEAIQAAKGILSGAK